MAKSKIVRTLQTVPWLVAGALLLMRAPLWWDLFKLEGSTVPRSSLARGATLESALNEPVSKILVFWASWCGPCKIELGRFADEVRAGGISGSRILAVSIDEDPAAYIREIAERKYPFKTFLDESGLASKLRVKMTPTVLHLRSDQTIAYATSGVSPLGMWKARRFLAQ